MYERAKYFIVSEVAHVQNIDEDKAEKKVEKALETTIQKRQKATAKTA
jgi:RNA polymerase-interacting CarD/CdnL/TRCF family regulator